MNYNAILDVLKAIRRDFRSELDSADGLKRLKIALFICYLTEAIHHLKEAVEVGG